MRSTLKIGGRKIGDGERVFLALDLARTGHDLARAEAQVDAAAQAAFDAVCLHLGRPDDLLVRPAADERGPSAEYRRALARDLLPGNALLLLAERVRRRRLALLVQVHDLASAGAARDLAPDALLLESSSLVEEELLLKTASLGKPILLKVGGATAGEIESGVNTLRKAKARDLAVVHAFSPWLPSPSRVDLALLPTLRALFGVPVGYGFTAAKDDPHAIARPVAAVSLGASLLLRASADGPGDPAKGSDPALEAFVDCVRAAEEDLGSPFLVDLNESELSHRETVRKKTVAARAIAKGEVITYRDLAFKLGDSGVAPDLVGMVVGRRALRPLAKDEGVTPESFMEI